MKSFIQTEEKRFFALHAFGFESGNLQSMGLDLVYL
jgi:hypothetical protein